MKTLLKNSLKKKNPSKGKVKNVTPNEYDGVKFRSKLETYTYKKLKEAKIDADYEQHRFQLLPAFQYGNKKYRPMTYLPDFVGKDFVIECKGYPNDSWALREKLFNYYLYQNNSELSFYVVHTLKEVDALIDKLKI